VGRARASTAHCTETVPLASAAKEVASAARMESELAYRVHSLRKHEPYALLTADSDGLSAAFDVDRQHVLITHGWGGSAEQMHALANAIADRGMVPIIVEMPGHGRSRGLASSMPQFARALEYVATHLTMNGVSIQAVVAHSLGASAAAFAVTHGLRAERLVLIAPPDRPRDFTAMFAQVFGLSERTRARTSANAADARGARRRRQRESVYSRVELGQSGASRAVTCDARARASQNPAR
jgi:pimeloyl-ACP methyl ester carboxylesterase